MATTKRTKLPNFEKALSALEAIVESLEKGNLTLEEALKNYEEGVKLTRECQAALKNAQQRVKVLLEENQDLAELKDTADEL